MIRMPRVHRHGDIRMVFRERPFGELQLAEADRTRVVQSLHHRAVERRTEVAMNRHACRRRYALRVAEVLERHRHAVQCAAIAPLGDLVLGAPCLLHREFGRHQRVGMQATIHGGDAIEHCLGHFDGRNLARLDEMRDFGEFEVVQVGGESRGHGGTVLV